MYAAVDITWTCRLEVLVDSFLARLREKGQGPLIRHLRAGGDVHTPTH